MEKIKIQDEFRQKKSRDKNEDGDQYFSVLTSLGQHLLWETHFSAITAGVHSPTEQGCGSAILEMRKLMENMVIYLIDRMFPEKTNLIS